MLDSSARPSLAIVRLCAILTPPGGWRAGRGDPGFRASSKLAERALPAGTAVVTGSVGWYAYVPLNPQRCRRGLRATACRGSTSNPHGGGLHPSQDGPTARREPCDLHTPRKLQPKRDAQDVDAALWRAEL